MAIGMSSCSSKIEHGLLDEHRLFDLIRKGHRHFRGKLARPLLDLFALFRNNLAGTAKLRREIPQLG